MYESERQELIDKLAHHGIEDINVLKAMNKVDRHKFVPGALHLHAYKDVALPIGYGQTISQPYTVAY
ncbi:MAG: protein-L-isoaspartate O-methyltransferase family protein, partial [Ignavibacteria bacterium]